MGGMNRSIALLGALGGLLLAGWAFLHFNAGEEGGARTEAAAPNRSSGDADLVGIERRLADQEDSLRELSEQVVGLELELRRARKRAEEAESERDTVRNELAENPSTRATSEGTPDPLGESELDRLRLQALDTSNPNRDRVLAARRLWYMDLETGMTSSLTPEIIDGQLALLTREPDPELRRMACFNALGRTEPRHAQILMTVLGADLVPDVRAQAADTLQDLLDLPEVRAALERASLRDPSEEVRSVAAEMLTRWSSSEE